MISGRFISGLIMAVLAFSSVSAQQKDDHFGQVFSADCCGWTGGDGVYSIPLEDGRSVFLFGDTFLGEVKNGSRSNKTPLIKNTISIYYEGNLTTLFSQGEKPGPFFKTNNDSTWYWPGHGYEYEGMLTVFLSRFRASGTGVFGFEWDGTAIARIKAEDLGKSDPLIVEWDHGSDIHYGNAVLTEDEWLYTFGVKAFRVYVSRTYTGKQEFSYWDGNDWSKDATKSSPIPGLYVSEQFSFTKLDGQYVVISQGAMLGQEIYGFVSNNMMNGWSEPVLLHQTPERAQDSTLFTYNALVHPQFNRHDSLLISYCVNSTDFYSIYKNADRYRPRFIRIPMERLKK